LVKLSGILQLYADDNKIKVTDFNIGESPSTLKYGDDTTFSINMIDIFKVSILANFD